MTRRAFALLPVLIGFVVFGYAAACVAQDGGADVKDGPGRPGQEDLWRGYAAMDDEVARRGRAGLPFTQKQIRSLARLLEQTQRATAQGAGRPVVGELGRIRIAMDVEVVPEIRVRHRYTTVVMFTGVTGAPWPIEEVVVDRRFLPEGDRPEQSSWGSGHLIYLFPRAPFLAGNLVVKLQGLARPVVATLAGGSENPHFGLDLRLGMPGPNVDAAALAKPEAFRAGDAALFGVLTGSIPAGAVRLKIDGGELGDRAWRLGDDILLLTRAHVLSPGPWAAERGGAGRWAYRLPETPYALVSVQGQESRLVFGAETVIGTNGELNETR